MSNLKKTSYVFIALAIALLLAAISISVAFNVNKAYADYEDIIDDPNSIVYFNQISNNIDISITDQSLVSEGSYYYKNFSLGNSVDFVVGHRYFIIFQMLDHSSVVHDIRLYFNSYTQVYVSTGDRFTALLTYSSFNFLRVYATNTNYYNVHYNLCAIDLDIMFGSDNIPTLSQCREIFLLDYYPYNTGSAMSFGTIESYNKGVEDTLNSFDLTLSQYLVGSSAFAFNNSTITGSTITYDNTVNSYVFKNVIGVPLMDTIESGTNFTVDFTLWDLTTGESQSYYMSQYLCFGYVDSNNNLVSISKLPATDYVGEAEIQFTGVFVLPVSTNTIYIWVSYNNDLFSDDSFIALDSNITFRSLNVASLIKASYAAGLQYNKDFYSVGGAGYNQIYQSGYHAGMLVETPYTFSHLLTAVIEAPLGAVLEIFNFDFMGYNFKNFITVMFTLCLIIAIVRMFMGGKE